MKLHQCFGCRKWFATLSARIKHSDKCRNYVPIPDVALSLFNPNMLLIKTGLRGSCKRFQLKSPNFIIDLFMASAYDSFLKLMRAVRG